MASYSYKVEELGGKYVFTFPFQGVQVTAERIRQSPDGRVTCRATFAILSLEGSEGRKTKLHTCQLNLLSTRSKQEVAKILDNRYELDIPWAKIVEDVCREVLDREEYRPKAERIMLVEQKDPDFLVYPAILDRLVNLWYGPGGTGKTMIALYFALIIQNGIPFMGVPIKRRNVLYCDWEVDKEEAARRCSQLSKFLFATHSTKIEMPYYRQCILPLVEEAPEITEDLIRNNCGVLIIDSAGPACGGDIQSGEIAIQFFNSLRKICSHTSAASLVLTHITKDERRKSNSKRLPIGSIYFENLPRATWELRPIETEEEKTMTVGFFCRKANLFSKPKPFGIKLTFEEDMISVEATQQVEDYYSEEKTLAAMVLETLEGGLSTAKDIAEKIGVNVQSVWVTLNRLKKKKKVVNLGEGRWGLAADNIIDLNEARKAKKEELEGEF